eukprot:2445309-Pleurochrysis_carterae.AAC.1
MHGTSMYHIKPIYFLNINCSALCLYTIDKWKLVIGSGVWQDHRSDKQSAQMKSSRLVWSSASSDHTT